MTKWDKAFRIAVLLLLAANLAVSCVVCARLGSIPVSSGASETSGGKAETAGGSTPDTGDTALVLPGMPVTEDAWYDYGWVYESADYVEIIRLPLSGNDWHFEPVLPGANVDLTVKQVFINNLLDGQLLEEFTNDDLLRHMAECNGLDGEVVLRAGQSLVFDDWHPYTTDFNGRELAFVMEAPSGESVRYSFIFELTGEPAQTSAADYSTAPGKDLALLRHGVDYAVETFDGVFWVPAVSLGESRYTNAEIAAMLSLSPEEKQEKIGTLYEALQLYQIGDFRSADDNVRVRENGIDWEYHTPGRNAVINNCGCCATDSAWLRYLLDGDYDELGYISTSQRDGSGHIYNYIRDGEWYYIIDLTHYRNDWIATIEENSDLDAYMRSDRVLGNIHRTKELARFVNYVQSAFTDPPGLMFLLTCEEVPTIDGVRTPGGVQITRPQSCEPYVTCIFDDDTDSLTYGYAADPTNGPYSS